MTGNEKKRQRGRQRFALISVCSLYTFFIIWCIATAVLQLMPDYALPSPVQVLQGFLFKLTRGAPDGETLFQHIAASLKVAPTGYFLGTTVGVPLGIYMAWFRKIGLFMTPLFDLVRPVPMIAWIPLMILWFGIGLGVKAAIIFVSAFVPCVISTYAGIKQTKPMHLWVAQTFGTPGSKMLFTVAIPTAVPLIFTGLRISLGTAWMTLCAAEMLAANRNLGCMIQLNRALGRADMIVMSMLTIGVTGAIFIVGLRELKNLMIRGGKKS